MSSEESNHDSSRFIEEHMTEAVVQINVLREWLEVVEKEIKGHKEGTFPIKWCKTMMEHSLRICTEVSLANGAVLANMKN